MGRRSDLLRSPDWDALNALVAALCREQGLVTKGGKPSYVRLARACGLAPATIQAWQRREQRPSRAMLTKVAQYAGQDVGPWLHAGGFAETEQVG